MVLVLFGPGRAGPAPRARHLLPVERVHRPGTSELESGPSTTRWARMPPVKPILGHALFQAASYFKPAGRIDDPGGRLPLVPPRRGMVPFHRHPVGSSSRRNPGIFKVQIQRQVAEGESVWARAIRSSNSSRDSFLAEIESGDQGLRCQSQGGPGRRQADPDPDRRQTRIRRRSCETVRLLVRQKFGRAIGQVRPAAGARGSPRASTAPQPGRPGSITIEAPPIMQTMAMHGHDM